jgi:hypothetical protein
MLLVFIVVCMGISLVVVFLLKYFPFFFCLGIIIIVLVGVYWQFRHQKYFYTTHGETRKLKQVHKK